MQIREALIYQHPSLVLQRAAADEIAKLDYAIQQQEECIQKLYDIINAQNIDIEELEAQVVEANEYRIVLEQKCN